MATIGLPVFLWPLTWIHSTPQLLSVAICNCSCAWIRLLSRGMYSRCPLILHQSFGSVTKNKVHAVNKPRREVIGLVTSRAANKHSRLPMYLQLYIVDQNPGCHIRGKVSSYYLFHFHAQLTKASFRSGVFMLAPLNIGNLSQHASLLNRTSVIC